MGLQWSCPPQGDFLMNALYFLMGKEEESENYHFDCMDILKSRVVYGSGSFAQIYQPHAARASFTHENGFKAKM